MKKNLSIRGYDFDSSVLDFADEVQKGTELEDEIHDLGITL